MTAIIIALFVANAIAHFISFQILRKTKAPNAVGVLAFLFINAIIVYLIWQELGWAKWLALIFPTVGCLGLLISTILKGKGIWIDFVILVLDIAIVGLVLKQYFL